MRPHPQPRATFGPANTEEQRAFRTGPRDPDHTVMNTTLTAPGDRLLTSSFSPTAPSVRAARQFVRGRLAATDVDLDLALLLTSELATNAVVHGRTEFEVLVTMGPDWCRVGVADHIQGEIYPRTTPATATGGRGLRMIDALADRWGCDQTDTGKIVWFELRYG